MNRIWRYLTTTCIALVTTIILTAAPIPPQKTKKSPLPPANAHVGSWRMQWGVGQGDVVFAKDGGYWCLWAGQQWVGHWRWEGKVLVVVEGRVPDQLDSVPSSPIQWGIELTNGTSGEVVHGDRRFTFRLVEVIATNPSEIK